MRKTFTLLMAFAMVFALACPSQAQKYVRKSDSAKFKVNKAWSSKQSASQSKSAFKETEVSQTKGLLAKKSKVKGQRTPGRAFREATAATHGGEAVKTPLRPKEQRQVLRPFTFKRSAAPFKTFRANGEIQDEHGIIIAPADGQRKVYSRSGMMYVNDPQGGVLVQEQTGNIHIVDCGDGTVYIRNLLASHPSASWVKGTKDGNTITVASRQPIIWNDQANVTYSVRWGICENEWGALSFSYYNDNDITFTIDEENNTITLQNSSNEIFIGLFWDDDDAFAWHGDYESVWTYVQDFEPMPAVTVAAPAGLTMEDWYIRGHQTVQDELQLVKGNVKVGFLGNDVYLQGVFAQFPEGWMKGTLADGVVTFDYLQLQGTQDDQSVYAVGSALGDLMPFTMTYDAEQKVLQSTNSLLANTSTTDVAAVDSYTDITIQLSDPFAPIETLPYINSIGTQEEWEWFTVIDANGDGTTWHLFEGQASYKYNPENAADDWLISPAIRLEAGKTYSVSIDANCSSSSYAERVEVLLGSAATAEAMTQQVIADTSINSESPVTLTNKIVTVTATGTYYIGIHAISPADQAALRVCNFVVDETILTAPVAVSDLNLTANATEKSVAISFTAPSKNIGGDELTAPMTITILRDGEPVTTLENVAAGEVCSYTDTELEPGTYTYTVLTSNADGNGERVSGKVTLTAVYDIPYVADFSEEGTYDQFTAINANDDSSYWEDNVLYAAYSYSSVNAADDYLVTPGLFMEAGKRYNIIVDAEAAGDYPERFEVVVGKEPSVDGLTTIVINPTVIIGSEGRVSYEGVFTCEESGVYYASVHCISDADMYEFMVYRIAVEMAPELTAPAAPTLVAEAGANGAKQVSVTVNVPATSIDGETLTSPVDIEILRNGELLNTYKDQTPGAELSFTDSEVSDGLYTYQAIPYNASGIGMKSEIAKVYVGIDIPQDVTGLKATDQQTSVLLTWDAVSTVGANGGYVDPSTVTYKIWACEPGSTYIASDEPIATVTGDTSYLLSFNTNEGEQTTQSWVVTASNEAGETSAAGQTPATLTIGKSYDLPFIEGFADGSFHYYCDYIGTPLQFNNSSDGDGVGLALVSQEADSDVAFLTGKISLKGASNPTVLIDAAGFGVTSMQVIATTDGVNTSNLGTFAVAADGYKTIELSLADFKDADYVMLGFAAHITNATEFDFWTGDILTQGDALTIDNIRVVDYVDRNLIVTGVTTLRESIQAGQSTSVMAAVTNAGKEPANGFTILFKKNGKEFFQGTVNEVLASFKSGTFIAELPTTIFDEAGDMTITAEVVMDGDQIASDNTAETLITITEPLFDGPASLTAQDKGDAGVDLTWSALAMGSVTYTENFTSGTGGWTFIDADGDGYNWMVENNASSTTGLCLSESYSNTAQKALTPDNWLVSPQLVLDGTFSFTAFGLDSDYPAEHFAVCVSTAADPTDLTQYEFVSEFTATGSQDEYNVDLSSYAGQKGYVAIRHFNVTDMFMLAVTNVNYLMLDNPVAYNIYYEGEVIATVEGDKTTFTAAADKIASGERTFAVTAVFNNGQETKPVTATVEVTSGIKAISADSQPVDVYSVDGKLLRSKTRNLQGLKGVYIVNGRTVVLK